MAIVARGVVISGEAGTERSSLTFPGIAVLPSGRWLCTSRSAPEKKDNRGQHVLVSWSDDDGRTWSPPHSPFIPPAIAGRPGLFRTGHPTALGGDRVVVALSWVDYADPALPFFNEATEGLLDTRIFLAESVDGGATWSTPVQVDTAPFTMPTPTTGPLLVLPDGQWACQFELNKAYDDPAPWHHASVLLFSPDQGKSWPAHAVVSSDPANRLFYWDQRPGVLADGSLLDLFWTYDTAQAAYLNIHARASAVSHTHSGTKCSSADCRVSASVLKVW